MTSPLHPFPDTVRQDASVNMKHVCFDELAPAFNTVKMFNIVYCCPNLGQIINFHNIKQIKNWNTHYVKMLLIKVTTINAACKGCKSYESPSGRSNPTRRSSCMVRISCKEVVNRQVEIFTSMSKSFLLNVPNLAVLYKEVSSQQNSNFDHWSRR